MTGPAQSGPTTMNRRIRRQVLDFGDGVREVTALALATLFEWVGW